MVDPLFDNAAVQVVPAFASSANTSVLAAKHLHRHELTVQERADHIAEWVRLMDEKLVQLEPVCAGGRGNSGGLRAAARDIGVDRNQALRALKIAAIAPEAREAADATGLTTQEARLVTVPLDAFA